MNKYLETLMILWFILSLLLAMFLVVATPVALLTFFVCSLWG